MNAIVQACRGCWALLALVAVAALPAQAEGRAVGELQRAFRPVADDDLVPLELTERRRAALEAVETFDSPRVASALADAFAAVDGELGATEQRGLRLERELEQLLKGQLQVADPQLTQAQHDAREALQQRARSVRRCVDDLRHLRGQVGRHLLRLRDPAALKFLLQRVVGDPKRPMSLRIVTGQALGAADDQLLGGIAKALAAAREPEAALALIDALGLAGERARPYVGVVLQHLGHEHEAVRERAALALAHIAVAEAIGPMVALLERQSGQSRLRVCMALEVLTGQRFGTDFLAWKGWWEQDGQAFLQTSPPLGTFEPRQFEDRGGKSYYFGIPQEHSDAILYCIDCSGSMKEEVVLDPHATAAPGSSVGQSRLDACKQELLQALAALRPDQRFAILWYTDQPFLWRPTPEPATPSTVAAAQTFVRSLQPLRTTNIHAALGLAFTLVGRGARDRYYGTGLDTVFLLTDGTPTHADGSFDRTERILDAVRTWNPLGRVTIHTIGIGDGLDEEFLGALAAQNGGRFVKL